MLTIPTLEKLRTLHCTGMARAFEEQLQSTSYETLSFEERLGLVADREILERENRRLKRRLANAKIRQQASLEDLDTNPARGLDKSLLKTLSGCAWTRDHLNILIDGPTGSGKTFLACAFAHKACREGFNTLYFRVPRLFEDLAMAHADGRYPKLMNQIAKAQVLVLDDWGLAKLTDLAQRDFLEILEDRHGSASTIIAGQLPASHWHELMDNPTIADAILDRLLHNAYKIHLKGESMRKKKSKLTGEAK